VRPLVIPHTKQCTKFEVSSLSSLHVVCDVSNLVAVFTDVDFFGCRFYRAMHFSAKRGIAIACRLSVCLSVCPSVCDVGGL